MSAHDENQIPPMPYKDLVPTLAQTNEIRSQLWVSDSSQVRRSWFPSLCFQMTKEIEDGPVIMALGEFVVTELYYVQGGVRIVTLS